MAVKGYTDSQKHEHDKKRTEKMLYILFALQLLLAVVNVVMAAIGIGIAAPLVTVIVFLVLFVLFVRGADILDQVGEQHSKRFKVMKIISLVVYLITFVIGIFA